MSDGPCSLALCLAASSPYGKLQPCSITAGFLVKSTHTCLCFPAQSSHALLGQAGARCTPLMCCMLGARRLGIQARHCADAGQQPGPFTAAVLLLMTVPELFGALCWVHVPGVRVPNLLNLLQGVDVCEGGKIEHWLHCPAH